jgi:hypothetical protein
LFGLYWLQQVAAHSRLHACTRISHYLIHLTKMGAGSTKF